MASLFRTAPMRQALRVASRKPTATFLASPLSRSSSTLLNRSQLAQVPRIAAFHTTSKQLILPPLPQVVEGTTNDPVAIKTPSPSHGSIHWSFERLVSAGLIPLTIAPFAAGTAHPLLDASLCGMLLVHSHIGFQSVLIDYLPVNRVPKTRKLFMWGLNLATILVGIGLYEFETNDVGVTEAIKRIWHA